MIGFTYVHQPHNMMSTLSMTEDSLGWFRGGETRQGLVTKMKHIGWVWAGLVPVIRRTRWWWVIDVTTEDSSGGKEGARASWLLWHWDFAFCSEKRHTKRDDELPKHVCSSTKHSVYFKEHSEAPCTSHLACPKTCGCLQCIYRFLCYGSLDHVEK